jgi:Fe-S-cluster containining protein
MPHPSTPPPQPPPNDATLYERVFNLPKPQCCSQGDCCKGASPSVPVHQLWAKAAAGDEFARGFLSIFVPYASHAEAAAVVPGLVERSLKAAANNPKFTNGAEDVVFFHCRYHQSNNLCGVHEDRPEFCRSYPDSPFVVMAPGCAFEEWGKACKQRYHAMKQDVAQLQTLTTDWQALEQAVEEGWGQRQPLNQLSPTLQAEVQEALLLANWPWVASLCRFWVSSPLGL